MLRDAGLGKRREKLKAKPLGAKQTMPDPFSTEKHVCTCGKPKMPAFPAFTDCKDGAVQVKWLEVYRELVLTK
jgi:hypothetical protein